MLNSTAVKFITPCLYRFCTTSVSSTSTFKTAYKEKIESLKTQQDKTYKKRLNDMKIRYCNEIEKNLNSSTASLSTEKHLLKIDWHYWIHNSNLYNKEILKQYKKDIKQRFPLYDFKCDNLSIYNTSYPNPSHVYNRHYCYMDTYYIQYNIDENGSIVFY
uniref:Uncharacterized protein n=1 Tax=viral metagenome TaxID=1070528 RepID=A0A6C0J696_9ZZZZ